MRMIRMQAMMLVAFLAWAAGTAGLTLYRYVDFDGRVVVVDSLEKVPEECRKSLRVETIGKWHAAEPPEDAQPAARLDSGEQEQPGAAFQTISSPGPNNGADAGGAPDQTASDAVFIDVEHASATLWLSEMQQILRRNDEIWHAANVFTPYHRRILALQEENLRAVDRLGSLETMTWKDHQDWIDRARGVSDQLRQLAFTITLWLRQNPEQLKRDLAPFVNRVRMVLDLTAQALPPVRKEP